MAYTKLYYHVIWSTKNREQIISTEIEDLVHSFITKKAIGIGGRVYAINGVSDHIHLAVSIPPTISISKFIGQIKAVASVKINKSGIISGNFYWQSSYSIFTFRESELIGIKRYINRQKQHHAEGSLRYSLEIIAREKY